MLSGVIRESERKEGLNEEYCVRDIALGLIRNESLCPDCEVCEKREIENMFAHPFNDCQIISP